VIPEHCPYEGFACALSVPEQPLVRTQRPSV